MGLQQKVDEMNRVAEELKEVMKPIRARLSYAQKLVKQRRMINKLIHLKYTMDTSDSKYWMVCEMLKIKQDALQAMIEGKQIAETVEFQESLGVKL